MICKNCGGEIADDARFCNLCGAVVQQEQTVPQPQPVQNVRPQPLQPVQPQPAPAPAAAPVKGGGTKALCTVLAMLLAVSLMLGWFSFKMKAPIDEMDFDEKTTEAFEENNVEEFELGVSVSIFGISRFMHLYNSDLFTAAIDAESTEDAEDVKNLFNVMDIIFLIFSGVLILVIALLILFAALTHVAPRFGAVLGQIGSALAFLCSAVFGAVMLFINNAAQSALEDAPKGVEIYVGNGISVAVAIGLSILVFILITVFKKKWYNRKAA